MRGKRLKRVLGSDEQSAIKGKTGGIWGNRVRHGARERKGMSIKPILFNTDMVRAILDGRKTVTRRVVKLPKYVEKQDNGLYTLYADGGNYKDQEIPQILDYLIHPYQPEDIIYVRESQSIHRINNMGDKFIWVNYKSDGSSQSFKVSEKEWERLAKYDYTDECYISPYWTTYETARIWLKVANVRVERLQDITTDQIEAEGIETEHPYRPLNGEEKLYAFSQLWVSTVKEEAINRYGWKANPFVWVIEFERCEKPKEVNYER